MTPMDDVTAMATMTAILADHERWVARYQVPDVDETGPDGARNEAGFAILEASKDENGGALRQTTPAVAPTRLGA